MNDSNNNKPSSSSTSSPAPKSDKNPRKRGGRNKKGGRNKSSGHNQQEQKSAINHSSGIGKKKQNRKSGSSKNRRPSQKSGSGKSTKKESPLNKTRVYTEDFSVYTAPTPKNYQVKMFDTFKEAHSKLSELGELANGCDQLNVVIKAEGNMEDPQILEASPKIKLFAGEAWFLIHTRRVEEDWYSSKH